MVYTQGNGHILYLSFNQEEEAKPRKAASGPDTVPAPEHDTWSNSAGRKSAKFWGKDCLRKIAVRSTVLILNPVAPGENIINHRPASYLQQASRF
jgi:hypothetical protein